MWRLDYTQEVKIYFLDNYPYTFNVLVEIEKLKFEPSGTPPEGCTQIENDLFWWEILDHIVIYERLPEEKQLIISSIKPV